jgi:hypothetical protein
VFQGVFSENSKIVAELAESNGLLLLSSRKRQLPENSKVFATADSAPGRQAVEITDAL